MKRAVLLAFAIACRSSDKSAPAPAAKPAPATSDAAQLVALSCTACHGADLLAQQRLTKKQWEAGVKKMVGWGALVEDKDQAALVDYLAAHYDGATFSPPEASAEALTAIEPTDDGAFGSGVAARGRDLYTQACAACHAPDGKGNAIGTNLVDRYLLYRANDFAAIVRAGRGRMPAQPLADPQIADLLAFLRSLPAA